MIAGQFGERLRAATDKHGPLCVGIDPHPGLLAQWGLTDDVAGLERFALTVVEALADRVAVLKPQAAFFERFGSAGVAVLERVIAEVRSAGGLSIVDAKRGDIGSTMAAYAEAFVGNSSPLAGDAVTVSPYLGFESLRPVLSLAAATGRGVFVLALTSNPEGAQVQHARGADGRTVAQTVIDAAGAENARAATDNPRVAGAEAARAATDNPRVAGAETAPAATDNSRAVAGNAGGFLGSVGIVVGATVTGLGREHDLSHLNGPILAPGIGAQGATAADLRAVFGSALDDVLPNSSREVLGAGPGIAGLREAAERALKSVTDVLTTTSPPGSRPEYR